VLTSLWKNFASCQRIPTPTRLLVRKNFVCDDPVLISEAKITDYQFPLSTKCVKNQSTSVLPIINFLII
jgi:hypothetical protein